MLTKSFDLSLGFCDKNGKPLPSLAGVKVGDTIYRRIGDRIVAGKVTSTNPFTVQTGK